MEASALCTVSPARARARVTPRRGLKDRGEEALLSREIITRQLKKKHTLLSRRARRGNPARAYCDRARARASGNAGIRREARNHAPENVVYRSLERSIYRGRPIGWPLEPAVPYASTTYVRTADSKRTSPIGWIARLDEKLHSPLALCASRARPVSEPRRSIKSCES